MQELTPIYLRMKQAVTWLKQNKDLLQKDIAKSMGMSDVSFSRGMERLQHKIDEAFVVKFYQATGEIFSLDWLLNGTLPKFTSEITKPKEPAQPIDQSSLVNAALAAKDETIAALREQIAAKDELIAALRQQLDILQQLRHSADDKELFKDYPFPRGIADNKDKPSAHV